MKRIKTAIDQELGEIDPQELSFQLHIQTSNPFTVKKTSNLLGGEIAYQGVDNPKTLQNVLETKSH